MGRLKEQLTNLPSPPPSSSPTPPPLSPVPQAWYQAAKRLG